MVGRNKASVILGIFLLLAVTAYIVNAASEPTAPKDLEEIRNQTFDQSNYVARPVEAFAGNITQLIIHGITQTRAWQGYWGNITGTITLDDEQNNTFYNWTAAEPQGEIYATLTSTVDWEQIDCFDFSAGAGANWDTIESYYNIEYDDDDGVNETYTSTSHDAFQVGWDTMTNCPTTYIFRDDVPQTADFQNVLLYDTTNAVNGWIYATIIENRSTGSGTPPDFSCFNGEICDFQILVNEDGHGTDTGTTTYYFWVELD